jgi:hypothetical protein
MRKAALAKFNFRTVAYNDAFTYQEVVDAIGIGSFNQNKIGI